MNCLSCGKSLPADVRFCNYCGASISSMGSGQSSSELPTMNVGPSVVQLPPENRQYITRQLSENMIYTDQLPSGMHYSGSQTPVMGSSPTYPMYSPQSMPGYTSSPSLPPTFPSSTPLSYGGPVSTAPLMPSSVPTAPIYPLSGFQRFLVGLFQPGLAGNLVLGVVLGSVVALVGGGLGTALLLSVAHSLLPGKLGEELIDRSIGILVPLGSPFRDTLQLLMLALGIGVHYSGNLGSGSSFSYQHFSSLHGFLVVPAVFLILGGYVSASTDLQNRIRASLLRGVAIAVPYTALLLLVSSQVNGGVPDTNGIIGPNSDILNMDVPTLLCFGVLWGCCFGFLGATLKLATGQWRRMVRISLQTSRYAQLFGMSVGALISICLGVGLSLLVIWCVVAYTSFSAPLLAKTLCVQSDWQNLTVWSSTQGPLYAVNLFAFSFGSPISIVNVGTREGVGCFYTMAPHTTLSIFDPSVQKFRWMYVLFLLPAISLFCGGRASVAIARSRSGGAAILQGVLIAIPFTLLMIAFCLMSTVSTAETYTGNFGGMLAGSAGVDIFTMLLWSLLSGAVFGGLGGLYQASVFRIGMERFLTVLLFPIRILAIPVIFLLDRISGQPRSTVASPGRLLLYAAFISAVLLAIAAGIAGSLLINWNQIVAFTENQRTLNIVDVLAIAIPGVLLLSAAAVAVTTNPDAQSVRNTQTAQVSRGRPGAMNVSYSSLPVQEGM